MYKKGTNNATPQRRSNSISSLGLFRELPHVGLEDAQETLKFPDTLLERFDLEDAHYIVVGPNSFLAAFTHQFPPTEKKVGRDAVLARDKRDAHP